LSIVLSGQRVRLRAFRDEEFARVWREETRDLGEHQHPIPDDIGERDRLFARLRLAGAWTPEELRLAIEGQGELVGDIQARVSNWALPPGVTELGINVFAGARGKGYGTEALQLLSAHLFDDGRVHRVQLSTDVENLAMRRAADKAGFACEGVLRSYWATPPDGLRDYAMYARIRSEHEGA
jgi:RimJ/RimL family protein N-acetyltransferase